MKEGCIHMTTKIQRTEHKNAVVKLVKGKRMILQIDIASVMNSKNIPDTVATLVKEGKLKRQKIQVRGPVGNLTNQWLVYDNSIKQNDILDFERAMVNKYFQSPLVENHCYKSPEQPIDQELKSNVVDMQEYIKVNNRDVKIKEYRGQRVITLYDIAEVHEVENRTIKENFNNNKCYLFENEDYYILSKVDYENFVNEKLPKKYNAIKEFILFTEQGYLLIVKSLTGQKAWDIQRQLVKSYFKIQEIKKMQENNLPTTKETVDLTNTYDILKVVASGITDLNDRVRRLRVP